MITGTSARPDLPVALVVGAGAMGVSTARRLGNHYRILLADLDIERVRERAAALRNDGCDAQGLQCDVTNPDSVGTVADVVAETGPLRAVAHVAAISPSMGTWEQILRLNLIGAAHVERALLPLAGQGTAAVFVSSLAAHLVAEPAPEVLAILDDPLAPDLLAELGRAVEEHSSTMAYSLAKLGLNRMCARRAPAWGRRDARIVSMSPGMIATPMGALEFAGDGRDAKLELLKRSPVGREGTMIETADAIEFLVSPRASFITGTDLLVDGGVAAAMRFPERESS
jgi:NAD(P)-dependent dehydrogenase (short-subunit alcohol dehydrogenase family)